MNILFLTTDFPNRYEPDKGLFNDYLVSALKAHHDVRVICPVPWTAPFTCASSIRNLAARRDDPSRNYIHFPAYYYPPKVMRRHYGTFLWWSIRRDVKRLLKAFRPDAVIAYWAHPDGQVAAHIARQLAVPSAVIVGGSDVQEITGNSARRRCVVGALENCDAIITVSHSLKVRIAELGISAEKVHVWHQGVDDRFRRADRLAVRERLGIPACERAILWVGRMVPVKGLEILLKAGSMLNQQRKEFGLYLVGDGPLRAALQAQVAESGLSNRVHFVGAKLHDELPQWYQAADLTVLSSWSEGFPNVLRESIACGTPFVATRVGGIGEIPGDNTERLVEPGDAPALARAIDKALSQPTEESQLSGMMSWAESAERLIRTFRAFTNHCPNAAQSRRHVQPG